MSDRSLSDLTAVTNPTAGDLGYLVSGGNSRKIDLGTLLLKVPLTSVDNTIPRFDGLLGKLQSSGISIDDSNNILLPSGSALNWNSSDVTVTHSANTLSFAGASSGYKFDAALLPTTSDGAALGSASLMWSDLFLATGAVQNWNNGNMTLTHSANNLLIAASGKSILNMRQNPAGNVGGTYLDLWPGNTAVGQHVEFQVISSDTNAGLSFRMKGTNPFVIHAPVDQSASASLALYENEVNGSERMAFFAAASIPTSFSLVWPTGVPALNDVPLCCTTAGVLSFNTAPRVASLSFTDGITAPGTVAGTAQIYVDSADGDLKCKFGDGFVRVIGADS